MNLSAHSGLDTYVRDRSDAFEAFFDEYGGRVVRALSVAFREPMVAEEAARETLIRAYTHWPRVGRMERPATWLYITASRHALRGRRSTRGEGPATSDAHTLERAIEELAERERLALVLHHHAGLSAAEIARALRCSAAAATATLREAHRLLGVERADDDDIPEVELDAP
jgi:DNA-directed RNA polymerase specialized sigma24 family protein